MKVATKSSKNFDKCFDLPNPGLRAYFQHVRDGNSDVYRTPFYKDRDLPTLLQEWERKLLPLKAKWPSLYQFEIDLGEKVGPMSVMKPLSERMGDIDAYYDLISLDQVPLDARAVDASKREWSEIAGLRIRGEARTVNVMKKSTNSGSPYFAKRRNVLDKTLPCTVWNSGESVFQNLDGNVWEGAAVLGWRGQEGGPSAQDVKQRVVWMFPFAVNIKELSVYQPLIEAFQAKRKVPAWVGMDAVDAEITRLFDTKGRDDVVICTDFSKFDQHFNPVCQDTAAELLSYLFGNSREIGRWLDDIYPIKYMIPLAYDWGKIRFGRHGMGSGSGGTNADETLLHRTLQHEAAILNGQTLNPHSQCLGDDGILSYPGCTVNDVVSAYTSHGLEMNPDKQYVSKHDCTYLRRWHHQEYRQDGVCVGVYATTRALGRLCMQERYYDPEKWGPKMVALRQLSILENVKYHPLREEFVSFCMKGDKYRLGLDIPGFFDNLQAEAIKAIDYMPDFLGYTKSIQHDGNPDIGINDWWIVKYLKSLA
nr:RNA-dependent RNA polymerase [Otarine picobirnavirus]